MPADRFGKGGERGRFKALCQRFFRNRSAYTTIAILKWVDRFKPQMRDTRPRDRRQRSCPCGRAVVEPCDKRLHFGLHAVRWRRFVVDAWSMKSARYDLHRIGMGAVTANLVEVTPAVHQHRMPIE